MTEGGEQTFITDSVKPIKEIKLVDEVMEDKKSFKLPGFLIHLEKLKKRGLFTFGVIKKEGYGID